MASVIKGHLTVIEWTRKEMKEPFLRMGQAIDDCTAREFPGNPCIGNGEFTGGFTDRPGANNCE